MKIKDVMTKNVITVGPRTTLKDVAQLMVKGAYQECLSSTTTEV